MFKPLMTAVGGIPATILAIFIGIIIYALALIVMGAVDAKDLRILFRNSKLADRIASIRLRNG
jgi:hypothetical protein